MRAEIYRAVLSNLALCISLGDRAEIYYIHVMRNSFETEPARFVYSPVLDHPSVHGQDDTGAVLDWTRLEALLVKFARIRQVVRAIRFWRCFASFTGYLVQAFGRTTCGQLGASFVVPAFLSL